MRTITCVNNDGVAIRFGNDFTPWLLTDVDGIYLIDSNVFITDNTMIDGATYQGANVKKRNIVLTMLDKGLNHQADRKLIYTVFKPKSKGTLTYEEGGDARTIDYYVENADLATLGKHRSATVSLICPDPFFEAADVTAVLIAGWEALWEFPHEFKLEEFGQKSAAKLNTITNDTAADNIGMTLTITSNGDVLNPSITRVESQQTIKIGTSAKPFTLSVGQKLIITTGINDKHIYFVSDGKRTEINEYMEESSEFIELMRGDNTIGYNADSGADYMNVKAEFRYKYLGV